MGALFGRFYLDSQQPIDAAQFQRQAAGLKHRARAGLNVHFGAGIALAWANSGTPTDHNLGAQPWIDQELLLIVDGRLTNRIVLAKALELAADAPTPAIISVGWRRWGERLFAKLAGHFALVLLDTRQRLAYLHRDNLGARALHWRVQPAGANQSAALLFASEAWLLAPELAPSERALAHYFAFSALPETLSFFDGVQVLPAGTTLSWQAGNVSQTRRPFDFAPPQKINITEAAEQFAELLRCAIDEHWPEAANETVGISLSGGLDSNALLAFAAGKKPQLHALSWRFRQLPECDEIQFAAAHALASGVPHTVFDADELACFALPALRSVSRDSPRANPYRELKTALYQQAAGLGINTVFNGNFGDHLYFEPAEWLSDAIFRRDFTGLASELFWRLQQTLPWREPSVRRLIRRLLGLPMQRGAPVALLTPKARRLLSAPDQRSTAGVRDHQQALLISSSAQFGASGEAEFAEAFGIDHATPFRTPALIRFMLALPIRHMHKHGQSKYILRHALRGRLPEPVRTRAKSTSLQPFLDANLRGVARSYAEKLLFFDPQWSGYLDPAALRAIWQKPNRSDFESALIWSCLSFEHWRRELGWRP